MAGLAFPKPRPRALEKVDRRKAIVKADLSENAKVKLRSHGRCEMVVYLGKGHAIHPRCERRAIHIHHLIAGIGVRGIGESSLMANKLHLCQKCHSEIHAHILVRRGDVFERVR